VDAVADDRWARYRSEYRTVFERIMEDQPHPDGLSRLPQGLFELAKVLRQTGETAAADRLC
jgi:hypothetical protein